MEDVAKLAPTTSATASTSVNNLNEYGGYNISHIESMQSRWSSNQSDTNESRKTSKDRGFQVGGGRNNSKDKKNEPPLLPAPLPNVRFGKLWGTEEDKIVERLSKEEPMESELPGKLLLPEYAKKVKRKFNGTRGGNFYGGNNTQSRPSSGLLVDNSRKTTASSRESRKTNYKSVTINTNNSPGNDKKVKIKSQIVSDNEIAPFPEGAADDYSNFVGLALHAVAVVDQPEICELLLEAEADIYKTDVFQRTCLHIAALHGAVNTMRMFLEQDAENIGGGNSPATLRKSLCYKRDVFDRTALFLGGFHGRMVSVDMLHDLSPYTPRTHKHCDPLLNILRYEERKKVFDHGLVAPARRSQSDSDSDSDTDSS